ncbi:PspC domain-containing protein [Streptomyces sp. DSM 44917]|uniref:PspC domain-containing protein n=1 Tax=Streptomyces boetiae TaxID=3075541 RepID=A0ABU2LAH3_9ACTN|nr:PspC domain-containing protein [Streptomyces sp. DSM 44917]MDT0308517.1 PspC domain-containing protein [Streptomyces sp. DSM 44917]
MTEDVETRETGREARLTRSRRHKVVGGVCGGLGRHYDLDPVIFRVPLAVLSVVGGLGLVVYGLAWLLIPFEREEENEGRRMLSGRVEGPGLTALLFIVAGCGLLLASLGSQGAATWFSVMVLAALAGAAYWSRHRRGVAAVDATAQEVQPPPAPAGPAGWQAAAPTATAAERAVGGYLWGPADYRPPPAQGRPSAAGEEPFGVWRPREAARPPAAGHVPEGAGEGPPLAPPEPREFRLGGLVLLLAAAAFAAATALAWEYHPLGTVLTIGFAAALAVFGAGFVVSAFAGRLGLGSLVCVILTGALLTASAALPDTIATSWTETEWHPEAVSEVRPSYELGSGDGELDLASLELPPGRTLRTAVEAGAGQVRVRVPRYATVTVVVEIGAGAFTYESWSPADARRVEDSWGGIGQERTRTYGPESGEDGRAGRGGHIELRLEMGVGYLVVERA